MYVTPPDTDIYAVPKVLAPMPQKVHSPVKLSLLVMFYFEYQNLVELYWVYVH